MGAKEGAGAVVVGGEGSGKVVKDRARVITGEQTVEQS